MAPGMDRSAWRGVASFAQHGTVLFGCVDNGLALGYFADRWLGTQPWLLLVGLGFGIAAAAVNFARALRALNRMNDGNNGN
jgi:ATP synthase protein I